MFTIWPDGGRSLEDFLGGVVTENHNAAMVDEISFIEVTAVFDIELSHLAVGQFDPAHVHGDHARADLEAEVAVDLSADGFY